MDKLQFAYTRRRSEFGRQCNFVDRVTELDVNVLPQTDLASQFIHKNPCDVKCEDGLVLSEHDTNTNYTELDSVGMNHTEGGWPKDVNPNDIDQTTRYRKKAEKEESFIAQVTRISQEMEHNIMQSNAVDIYQKYFDDDCLYRDDPPVPHAKVINNYRDPTDIVRPVSQIVWHPDGAGRFAVAHCILTFQGHTPQTSLDCYVWRTEDISKPELVLSPAWPVLCLRYNPKDQSILAGGQGNGQVVIWDLRKGNRPIEQTGLQVSHRDPVYDVTWIQSKAGTECFSISTDGQVLWWDVRNLEQPIDQMYIDPSRKNDPKLAEGGTCLEYDITSPTKFMLGTEQGSVFACSRRAKTPGEKVVTVYSGAQTGPIYALRRNPMYTKHFLTVGDWTAKVWSEDCKDSPLLWTTKYSANLTDGCWSPTRPSVFFVTKTDGTFDVWDLMFRQKAAEYSVQVSDDAIECISVQEQGQMVCVGTEGGVAIMLQLSEGLVDLQRNEKAVFSAMLERETKREKIIEGKEREKKLLQKKLLEDEEKKATTAKAPVDEINEADKAFFEIIEKEISRLEKENAKLVQSEKVKTTPGVSNMNASRSKEAFNEEEEPAEQGKGTNLDAASAKGWQQQPERTASSASVSDAEETAAAAGDEATPVDVHAMMASRNEDPSVEQLPSSAPAAEGVIGKEHPEITISHQPETDDGKTIDEGHLSAVPISGEESAFDSGMAPTPVVIVVEETDEEKADDSQTPEAAAAAEKKESGDQLPPPGGEVNALVEEEENLPPVPDIVVEESASQQLSHPAEQGSEPVDDSLPVAIVIIEEPEPENLEGEVRGSEEEADKLPELSHAPQDGGDEDGPSSA